LEETAAVFKNSKGKLET